MSILNKVFKKNTNQEKENEAVDKEIKKAVDKKEDEKKIADKNKAKGEEEKNSLKAKQEDKKKADVKEAKKQIKEDIFVEKVLIKPLLTEKITALNKNNKYVFEVNGESNKIEIRNAIKGLYGIMPVKVNIINMKGKKTGAMRRISGRRKNWAKAIITLKKGDAINIYGKEA